MEYRVFRGSETYQLDIEGRHDHPSLWYYEPTDHVSDILWSAGYTSEQKAKEAISKLINEADES